MELGLEGSGSELSAFIEEDEPSEISSEIPMPWSELICQKGKKSDEQAVFARL